MVPAGSNEQDTFINQWVLIRTLNGVLISTDPYRVVISTPFLVPPRGVV